MKRTTTVLHTLGHVDALMCNTLVPALVELEIAMGA